MHAQVLASNTAFVVCSALCCTMPILIILRIVTSQLYHLLQLLLPAILLETGVEIQEMLSFCRWGFCSDFVYDAILLLYFVTATFAGLNVSRLKQRAEDDWAIATAVVQAGAKLLLCCSVPVVVRLLGERALWLHRLGLICVRLVDLKTMYSLDIERHMGVNVWFQYPLLLHGLRVSFMAATAYRVLYLPPFLAVWRCVFALVSRISKSVNSTYRRITNCNWLPIPL